MQINAQHLPVMLPEVLNWLSPRAGGRYLDATVGLAGHAKAILDSVQGRLELLAIDRDDQNLSAAREELEDYRNLVHLRHDNFSRFEIYLQELGWDMLDGALLDLGVSSVHLDKAERGFSFLSDGPLDMRMDASDQGLTAAELVNSYSFAELKKIIREFGEEPMAGRIAARIVEKRQEAPLQSTLELAKLVESAYPAKRRAKSRRHPATKTFQAFRMYINSELEELSSFLEGIPKYLAPGARLVVISFHSLEDRVVKNFFRQESKDCLCSREQLFCQCRHRASLKILTKKPLTASAEEARQNPRSRSAKMRVAEKLSKNGN
jgi:16S rRNA (cytosine1402-N4)-methyltransferase